MVIDVPESSRGPDLPLGRYYPIIIESEIEQSELERFSLRFGLNMNSAAG